MEVGGRYHTIQVDFKECSEKLPEDLLVREEVEAFDLTLVVGISLPFSFSRFSVAVGVTVPKSNPVPGVRGVLAEEPNEAKAPDPRPKAEEPPLVGEETLVVVRGAMPLKGLPLVPAGPSPPKRFAGWYVRDPSDLFNSLPEFALDDPSLPELVAMNERSCKTWIFVAHFERRCHKLSIDGLCEY